MCGRFTLRHSARAIAEQMCLIDVTEFTPRYNIAPTQPVAAVRLQQGQRRLAWLHWGLIPSWADAPSIGNRMINARAETVADKPAFRTAFKHSRCLIVADGFYEWQQSSKPKQPYYFRLKDDRPFAFAGLCEHWQRGDVTIDSCTIITTDANELLRGVHDRMPVILPPEVYDLWLDPEFQGKEKLLSLLRPYPADEMAAHPVSSQVNSPRNEMASCIDPIATQQPIMFSDQTTPRTP